MQEIAFRKSALSSSASYGESDWTRPELCNSLVLYEDARARDLALQLCGGLSAKFKPDLGFQFHWCGFKYLYVPEIARQTGQAAVHSDLIIVCFHRVIDLPFEVVSWLELWLPQRTHGEGALVVLQTSSDAQNAVPWQAPALRALAQRANLDYLPFSGSRPAEASWDRLREDQVAPDSSEVIQPPTHQYHSSGWGINE